MTTRFKIKSKNSKFIGETIGFFNIFFEFYLKYSFFLQQKISKLKIDQQLSQINSLSHL